MIDRICALIGLLFFSIVLLFALYPFAGALEMAPWMVR